MIEIKLLSNKRFLYANRRQNIVITAENKATEISVEFPDKYENYSKRADFINSRGEPWTEALYVPEYKEYPPDLNRNVFTFTLPNEVTAHGELKMQFLAYMPDSSLTAVPFEIVPVYVEEGITAFKKGGRKNPDLLICSYNQSTEALFNSQQAKCISAEAEEKADSAIEKADRANTSADRANELLDDTVAKAGNAVTTANTALTAATAAQEEAAQATVKSENAQETALSAETSARQAKDQAAAADSNSQQAQSVAGQAKVIAQAADSKADQAVNTAETASLKSDTAKSVADYAKAKSDYATERAEEAVDIANDAAAVAMQAKSKASQAEQTAILAQNVVATAISDAANALAIASGIDSKVEIALAKSQTAVDKSVEADGKAVLALETAEEAKSLIQQADERSAQAEETARQAGGSATAAITIAETAKGIAETAATAAENSMQIAEEAKGQAVAAETSAAAALAQAGEAKTTAEQAMADASNAVTTANSAAQTANQAKDTADGAAGYAAEIDANLTGFKNDTSTALGGKVDKIAGKGLSTEDFLTTEKQKLAGIAAGAEVNVQTDWNESNSASDAYLKNKPVSLPASDVSAWAKSASKPAYTPGEVGAEPAFSKNTAFNKNFGSAAGTVCEGNDSRLSNSRSPTAHTHCNSDLTEIAAWAKSASKPIYTPGEVGAEPAFSKNSAFNKNFGTSAGTVCDGNDSRLSNSRPASDVSAWAKAAAKPSYTPSEVGAEPAFSKNSAFNKNFGTAAGTVCEGSDSRLSNSRPASDVYAWAKASSKPSYSASEVGLVNVANERQYSAINPPHNQKSGYLNFSGITNIMTLRIISVTGTCVGGDTATIQYTQYGSANIISTTVTYNYVSSSSLAVVLRCKSGVYATTNTTYPAYIYGAQINETPSAGYTYVVL